MNYMESCISFYMGSQSRLLWLALLYYREIREVEEYLHARGLT